MNVFLSWSGRRSKSLALQLRHQLRNCIQQLHPFMSEADIEPGANWFNTIGDALNAADGMGVFVLTEENLESRWLHFEAGWIASRGHEARVCCLLLGITAEKVPFPLQAFHSLPAHEESAGKLLSFLNNGLQEKLTSEQLEYSLTHFKPKFAEAIETALRSEVVTKPQQVDVPEQLAKIAAAVQRVESAVASQTPAFVDAMLRGGIMGATGLRAAGLNTANLGLAIGPETPVGTALGLLNLQTAAQRSRGIADHLDAYRAHLDGGSMGRGVEPIRAGGLPRGGLLGAAVDQPETPKNLDPNGAGAA